MNPKSLNENDDRMCEGHRIKLQMLHKISGTRQLISGNPTLSET
jgi:hypothetical protein